MEANIVIHTNTNLTKDQLFNMSVADFRRFIKQFSTESVPVDCLSTLGRKQEQYIKASDALLDIKIGNAHAIIVDNGLPHLFPQKLQSNMFTTYVKLVHLLQGR